MLQRIRENLDLGSKGICCFISNDKLLNHYFQKVRTYLRSVSELVNDGFNCPNAEIHVHDLWGFSMSQLNFKTFDFFLGSLNSHF